MIRLILLVMLMFSVGLANAEPIPEETIDISSQTQTESTVKIHKAVSRHDTHHTSRYKQVAYKAPADTNRSKKKTKIHKVLKKKRKALRASQKKNAKLLQKMRKQAKQQAKVLAQLRKQKKQQALVRIKQIKKQRALQNKIRKLSLKQRKLQNRIRKLSLKQRKLLAKTHKVSLKQSRVSSRNQAKYSPSKSPYELGISIAAGAPVYSKIDNGVYFKHPRKRVLEMVEITVPDVLSPKIGLGLEAIAYRTKSFFVAPTTTSDITLKGQAYFLNAYYSPWKTSQDSAQADKKKTNPLSSVFFGLGIGYAPHNKVRTLTVWQPLGWPVTNNASTKGLAYQAIVGYEQYLSSSLSLEAKARYSVLGKIKDCYPGGVDCSTGKFHNVILSLGIKKLL